MTPAELDRIKGFLARLGSVAEDFNTVFYNRLMSRAPDLKARYLVRLRDAGVPKCSGIRHLAELARDPAALEKALAADWFLSGPHAHRIHRLSFEAYLWTADRCLGAELLDEERAALLALHHAVDAAIDRVGGSARTGL